jgi:hypothetical protein
MIQMRDPLGKVEYEAILAQINTDLNGPQKNRYHNILGELQENIVFVLPPFLYFLRLTFCRVRTRVIKSHEPSKLPLLMEERPENLSDDDELAP